MNSSYQDKENFEFDKKEDELLDLRKLFNLFNRQKILIVSFTALATSFSIVYSILKVPIWRGTFQIVVSEDLNDVSKSSGGNSIRGLQKFVGGGSSELETQSTILKSPLVLDSVYSLFKETKKKEIDFNQWRKNFLKVDFKKDTKVLQVEYKDKNKEFILETLNLISSKYQDYSKRDRQRSINQGIEYLELQQSQLINKSRASLKKLNEFSIKNGLGDIDGFVELDNSIINDNQGESFLQIQEFLKNGALKNKNNLTKSGAGQRYSAQFSMLENLEAQYSSLSSNLKENSQFLSKLKLRIDNLRKSLKRPNEILLEYRTLKRVAGQDESILQEVESRLLALKLEKVRKQKPWELISNPTISSKRVTPKRKQIVLSIFISSILISFLLAKLKEKRSKIIYEKDNLKSLLAFPFLGNLYTNNLFLNDSFLKNNIYKKFTKEKLKFLYLNDSFFKNETNKILDLFSNISKTAFLNLDKIKKIDDTSNIVLIAEIGTLKTDKLDQIQKYLSIYEDQVIGWIYLEKDAAFS